MYKKVTEESDPKIIGVKNGVYQVDLKEQKSFATKEEQKYYDSFFDRGTNRMLLNSFKKIDEEKISIITYFPLKSAKETDFVSYAPREPGINFLVSEKCLKVLEDFKLPDYNKIKVSIEGFSNKYYAIGFPMVSNNFVDYANSLFVNLMTKENLEINNEEDYKNKKYIGNKKIIVKDKLDFDIIGVQGFGLYFSEALIEAVKNNKLTGLQTQNTEMIFE